MQPWSLRPLIGFLSASPGSSSRSASIPPGILSAVGFRSTPAPSSFSSSSSSSTTPPAIFNLFHASYRGGMMIARYVAP
ncbi:hypothetical protein E4U07_11025 [Bifidobacterium dentium]|nr:hypothetical protein E4U07_11025 [Bifidobacterium dentium]